MMRQARTFDCREIRISHQLPIFALSASALFELFILLHVTSRPYFKCIPHSLIVDRRVTIHILLPYFIDLGMVMPLD
jgi:hypothetical protein